MPIRSVLFATMTLAAASVAAQTPQIAPRGAGDPATLSPGNSPSAIVAFTLDTPIAQLVADPRARAVLDQDLPGLSDDPNLPKFQAMSLHQFQPVTGGQMTDAMLAKTGFDLAAIGSHLEPATPFIPVTPTTNPRTDSGR